MAAPNAMSTHTTGGYTTGDVARLLGLTPVQIRAYVHEGLVAPATLPQGWFLYSFQDLVVLRAAKELLEAEIPSRRIHESLSGLRDRLPKGRNLAGLRIVAEAGRVVVREADASWEAQSGQGRIDFGVAELASEVRTLDRRGLREIDTEGLELSADEWFELGLEFEPVAPDDAREAYRYALDVDPTHAETHLNLGRLFHEEGKLGAAEHHYREAARNDPSDPTASFNLGVVLEDLKRPERAIRAYEAALVADPQYADAYFNLSKIYEGLGEKAVAIQNLRKYKMLRDGEDG